MKRFLLISLLVFTFLIGASANAILSDSTLTAVISANKGKNFSLADLKEINATVSEVNTATGVLTIKEGATKKKVLTQNARIIQVSATESRSAALADLTKTPIKLYAKKTLGANKEYQALLIVQAVGQLKPAGTVQFSAASGQGLENVISPTLTVALSAIQTKDVKVSYTVLGTAIAGGTDYTLANGDITIPAGTLNAKLPLTVNDDSSTESNETVIVTLTAATEVVLGEQKVFTYTIQDNDTARVQFTAASSNAAESVSAGSIPVSLSSASPEQVLVDYTISGTATGSGTDFTLASGTATIAANQTATTIPFTVVDDATTESDETIIVTLSNPRGATLGANATYTYTITDNDQPRVNFNAASSSTLESGGSVNVGLTLSSTSATTVVTTYTVTGTATGSGADFTLANGTVSIAAGQTTGTITVPVVDDSADEADETVIITLASATGASLGTTIVHTLTLQDNDVPVAQFSSASGNGAESSTPMNVGVSLSVAPIAQVQITYTVSGTATGGGTDYTLANGTVTIAAGQTSGSIPLSIVDDEIVDVGETVIITFGSATNASIGATNVYTYTINDND